MAEVSGADDDRSGVEPSTKTEGFRLAPKFAALSHGQPKTRLDNTGAGSLLAKTFGKSKSSALEEFLASTVTDLKLPALDPTLLKVSDYVLPEVPPDRQLEAARRANERLEEVARLLREAQDEQHRQSTDLVRREAEQTAREERALALAEKSHAEAVASKEETRRARMLAAWSLAVAVLALVAGVVVPVLTATR